MGKIINLENKFENDKKMEFDSKIEKNLCILIRCIGNLVRNNISFIAELDKSLSDKTISVFESKLLMKNNENFVDQFYTMNNLLTDCASENSYQYQIQLVCDKFPENVKETIFDYLKQLYNSKEYLNFTYILAFLSKAKLSNNPLQLANNFYSCKNGMTILYNSIKLEDFGNVLAIDFNNIFINELELKLKRKNEIIEFLNSILSQSLILNLNHETIYTFSSYVQEELQKMNDEEKEKNIAQEELNKKNISDIYSIITENHFNFLYRFSIDNDNFINIYYNKKCCAFLEEVVKDGISSLKKINGTTLVSYPIELKNGDVINHYIDFSRDVEQQILNDSRRLNCIPYIRPYYTFPFGMSFSIFKDYDVNYYDLSKISEFDPNIKYMDIEDKIIAEAYYNAIRFITYAIGENYALSQIIGYENVIALNNSGLESISFGGTAVVIPFTKSKK